MSNQEESKCRVIKGYTQIKYIGRGGYGEVYLYTKNKQEFAIKRISGANVKDIINTEVGIFPKIKDKGIKGIVEYHEHFEDG
jgi:serine/threonine protein kinase